jgi:hypothetical protein
MTTIDQLKKHYNKLTAPERFALMVSAGARGDKSERKALSDSAPKVNFEFPNTQGLAEGFDFLTAWHVIQQLGSAGTFWLLNTMATDAEDGEAVTTLEGKQYVYGEAISLAARRFIEGMEAFKAVCQEYNIDPEILTGLYSGYEMLLAYTELVIKSFYDENSVDANELKDLEETKQAYRSAIEHEREAWAEARAKF